MTLVLLYLKIMLIMFDKVTCAQDDILVTLQNGIIRGRQNVTLTNKNFYAFQKIPFATPPIGELRFKPPVPAKKWDGILNTTKSDAICYQVEFNSNQETEDCLYLNVYTPNLPGGKANATLLPVMFYIHGGGFIIGSSLKFGPQYLIDSDVVVVTINYRLGPFGFLSTQDSVIPGNNGLRDQLLALEWTQANIELFGGDSRKVTVFGQSAGSASITYHFLHEKSKNLFRGAILQSGSFLNPWAFQRRARKIAFKTAGFINETFNNSNDSKALLEFLQTVTSAELDEASNKIHKLDNLEHSQLAEGFFFAPTIEPEHNGALITKKMYGELKAGHILEVPILMGITSEESIADAADLNEFKDTMKKYDEHLDWLVHDNMQIDGVEKRKQVGQQIRTIYTGNSTFQDNLGAGIRYRSDSINTRSVIKFAELQSQFTDLYFYQFSFDGRMGNDLVTVEGAGKVAHEDDLKYIWLMEDSFYGNSSFKEHQITQKRLQKIWTDFAKTLNPTPQPSELLQNLVWPKVIKGGKEFFPYVDIDTELTIKDHPKKHVQEAWNKLYNSLPNQDFDTY